MGKLNQVLAAETGVRSRLDRRVTDAYNLLQKEELFSGLTRSYTPNDEEGEKLPSEEKRVQNTVRDSLSQLAEAWTELFDIVLTKDEANRKAVGTIVVDDEIIASDVPVTTLLFLEKRLTDVLTFVSKVPVLDPSVRWSPSSAGQDIFQSAPTRTSRTKKTTRGVVLYEATDKHPAQVESVSEDVIVGTWELTRFSGAIEGRERDRMVRRIEKLLAAIKYAREEANSIEAPTREIGHAIFDFALASGGTSS
jgi:hypothetical protein